MLINHENNNHEKKNDIRKSILRQRLKLSKEEVAKRSKTVREALFELPIYKKAGFVMSYMDIRNEVETGPIIESSLKAGKRVAVPISDIDTISITASEIKYYPEDLTPGAYNILEPHKECIRPVSPKVIDIFLIPGIAFDLKGNRIGYGAGYYDRFLSSLRSDAVTVALAFDFQIVDHVFPEVNDIAVQYIVTDKRQIKCRKTTEKRPFNN